MSSSDPNSAQQTGCKSDSDGGENSSSDSTFVAQERLKFTARMQIALYVAYYACSQVLVVRKQLLEQHKANMTKIRKTSDPDFIKQLQLSKLEQDKIIYLRCFHYVFRGALLTYSRCFDLKDKNDQEENAYEMLGEVFAKKWKQGEWSGLDEYKLIHKSLLEIRDEAVRHGDSRWRYSVPLLHDDQTVCFVDLDLSYGLDFFDEHANILSNWCAMALIAIKKYSAKIRNQVKGDFGQVDQCYDLVGSSSLEKHELVGIFPIIMPDDVTVKNYVAKAKGNDKRKISAKLSIDRTELNVSSVTVAGTLIENLKTVDLTTTQCKKKHIGIVQETKDSKRINMMKTLYVAQKELTVLSSDLKNTDWLPATFTGVLHKILYYSRFIGILSEVKAQWTRIKNHYKGSGWFKDFDKMLSDISSTSAHSLVEEKGEDIIFSIAASLDGNCKLTGKIRGWDKVTEYSKKTSDEIDKILPHLKKEHTNMNRTLEGTDEATYDAPSSV